MLCFTNDETGVTFGDSPANIQWMSEASPRRRARSSRDEGRTNLLRATLELLEQRDPDEITVRDIAQRAGHHHRFVQDWFGGKAGLYLAALNETAGEIAEAIAFRPPGAQPIPAITRGVKLMTWLAANDPERISGERMRPVISRMAAFYHDRFGVEPDDALLLAKHTALVITAYVMFKDAFGVEPTDYPRLGELQIRLGQLLGTRGGT
jgi:AcrR family transcriptional regulator